MRRREFIAVLSAAAWPLPLSAQQPPVPVVGFLNSASPEPFSHFAAAFRKGLGEEGFVEGRNVSVV
jgi:putative ABC transport system substrate-binding protein